MSTLTKDDIIVLLAILAIVLLVVIAALVLAPSADAATDDQACNYVVVAYEVKKGDTWRKVAKWYDTSVKTLKSMNPGVKLVRGAMLRAPIKISCPTYQTPTPFPV